MVEPGLKKTLLSNKRSSSKINDNLTNNINNNINNNSNKKSNNNLFSADDLTNDLKELTDDDTSSFSSISNNFVDKFMNKLNKKKNNIVFNNDNDIVCTDNNINEKEIIINKCDNLIDKELEKMFLKYKNNCEQPFDRLNTNYMALFIENADNAQSNPFKLYENISEIKLKKTNSVLILVKGEKRLNVKNKYHTILKYNNIHKQIIKITKDDYINNTFEIVKNNEIESQFNNSINSNNNEVLLSNSIEYLVENNLINIKDIEKIEQSKKHYHRILLKNNKLKYEYRLNTIWKNINYNFKEKKKRHLWIWGPSKKGKSLFLSLLMDLYKAQLWTRNSLFQAIDEGTEILLIDEFDKIDEKTLAFTDLCTITDNTYMSSKKYKDPFNFKCKLMIIVSNENPNNVVKKNKQLVQERFYFLDLTNIETSEEKINDLQNKYKNILNKVNNKCKI